MTTKKTEDSLTEGEARFVQEFMVDRDPYMAATRAGVARVALKRTVTKWMQDPKVLRAIQRATDEMDVEKMISPIRPGTTITAPQAALKSTAFGVPSACTMAGSGIRIRAR